MQTDVQEIVKKEVNNELLQLVTFKLDVEEFGIDILRVQEIIRIMNITKVPNSPEFVEGVINLRGRVIPVINLRRRLMLPTIEKDNKTRVIVVELSDKTVGFIVDEVNEVLRIPKSITEPPPEMTAGIDSDYITSVGKLEDRLLILLDIEKLVDKTKF
ncbi:MAG: chemotaxis protein CheW [Ignavibacteriaceae bacterium]